MVIYEINGYTYTKISITNMSFTTYNSYGHFYGDKK